MHLPLPKRLALYSIDSYGRPLNWFYGLARVGRQRE
jgi:hypothetical protein